MRVTLLAGQLSAALAIASAAVVRTSYSQLPVLQNVLLEATPDGGLVVSGTDLITRAWHTVPARVDEPGAVALPPGPLADLLGAVSEDDAVTLVVDDKHKAEITSGPARVRVAGISSEEFPAPPDFSDAPFALTLAASAFSNAVASVERAIAPDASRPVLAGILLRVAGSEMTLVAADGYRLAMRAIPIDGAAELDVIVSGRPLAKAARALGKATSVRLRVDSKRSTFGIDAETGNWAIRLIDEDFPDFKRIIPIDAPLLAETNRAELVRALSLVRRVDETSEGYKVRLTPTESSIHVRAGGLLGDHVAETTVAATLVRGEGFEIGFNLANLAAALAALDSEVVALELTGPDRPCIVRAAGEPDGHQHILMPMYVKR